LSFALEGNVDEEVPANAPVYVYNMTLPANSNQVWGNFSVVNGTLYVALVPCFGEYNWVAYYGGQMYPYPWAGKSYDVIYQPMTGTYTIAVEVTGINNYNGIEAEFDYIVSQTDPDIHIVPQPGNGKAVTGKLSSDGGSGTLQWQPTDNATDTYSLYWIDGQTIPAGNTYSTACGVRRWMKPWTSDQGDFSKQSDGTWLANVKNLNTKTPRAVVVVVDRPGAYSAAYTTFIFNGASIAGTSFVVLALAVFAVLLF